VAYPDSKSPAWPGVVGGLLAASSIGLAASAAHGLDDAGARANLQTACLYAFGHGIALACLRSQLRARLDRLALMAIALGTVLFSGSLAGSALGGWPTRLAPMGGSLMICGWLAWAVAALRR
jgi:uncharacterized membrane protein YgdD (TMEM256/DUF423 family)